MNLLAITLNDLVISVAGYVIVFVALVLLYAFFKYLPNVLFFRLRQVFRMKKKKHNEPDDVLVSGEVVAAISMALHLTMNELHDKESGVLTIRKVSKTYSPWSSKIYAVRNQFNRN